MQGGRRDKGKYKYPYVYETDHGTSAPPPLSPLLSRSFPPPLCHFHLSPSLLSSPVSPLFTFLSSLSPSPPLPTFLSCFMSCPSSLPHSRCLSLPSLPPSLTLTPFLPPFFPLSINFFFPYTPSSYRLRPLLQTIKVILRPPFFIPEAFKFFLFYRSFLI